MASELSRVLPDVNPALNFFSRKPPPDEPIIDSSVHAVLEDWFSAAPVLEPEHPLTPIAIPSPLPEIEWRINARAKRLRLTLKSGRVWVTIPPRTSPATVKKFLKETESWLVSQWQAQQTLKLQHPDHLGVNPELAAQPQSDQMLTLPVLAQTWRFDVSADYSRLRTHGDVLHVPESKATQSLKQWVKLQAEGYLPDRLAQLAEQHGFHYSGCTVRHARGRWGSCSRQGKINLNAALMLIAPELIDYVLLHELCHTRQFNHSPLFWAEMLAVCPRYIANRRALKHIILPLWWNA